MIKTHDQKIIFNGQNFEKITKKLPQTPGRLFIVGVKKENRIPVSMFYVSGSKFERRETIKSRFLKKLKNKNEVSREDYLNNLIAENNFDKIILEWE